MHAQGSGNRAAHVDTCHAWAGRPEALTMMSTQTTNYTLCTCTQVRSQALGTRGSDLDAACHDQHVPARRLAVEQACTADATLLVHSPSAFYRHSCKLTRHDTIRAWVARKDVVYYTSHRSTPSRELQPCPQSTLPRCASGQRHCRHWNGDLAVIRGSRRTRIQWSFATRLCRTFRGESGWRKMHADSGSARRHRRHASLAAPWNQDASVALASSCVPTGTLVRRVGQLVAVAVNVAITLYVRVIGARMHRLRTGAAAGQGSP